MNSNNAKSKKENLDQSNYFDIIKYSEGNEVYQKKPLNDTILMLLPSVFSIDMRRKNEVNLLYSEKSQQELTEYIVGSSSNIGLSINFLNNPAGNDLTSEQINDYALITDWLTEVSRYGGFGLIAYDQPLINRLTSIYGTSQLAFMYVWSFKMERPWVANYFAIFTFPDDFSVEVGPIRSTDYVFAVIDLNTGNYDFVDFRTYRNGYRKDLVGNQVYHSIMKGRTK